MSHSHFILVIFLFFFIGLSDIGDAYQADMLKLLIKSTNSTHSSHYDLQTETASSSYSTSIHVSPQEGMMEADRITEWPGQPNAVDFNQYSGYVTVDGKNGRALFYYFVEATSNSSTSPLLLWLNTGPGCSSIGIGALSEIGPFRINSDGMTLSTNCFAWNNVANVLFLESPAGVGFSYSNTTSDYNKSGDQRTADDSYIFLLNWLERFPQYKNRALFIIGESYAGHYIPQLAYTIQQRSKIAKQTVINLQGIAIGNAYVEDGLDSFIGQVEFDWSHAYFSDETHDMIIKYCNLSSNSLSDECYAAIKNYHAEMEDAYSYNIYRPPNCPYSPSSSHSTASFDLCTFKYVVPYLNRPVVQKALHADVVRPQKPWDVCNRLPWNDRPDTMLPIFKKLISSNISIWLYSGNIDGYVPITTTRLFIKKLGLTVKTPWRPWYVNEEVGGYVEEYHGLTLAILREAGHEAVSFQPERAFHMIKAFLRGQTPR